MNPATEKRRGFTLVELLVVIAIIGVLIGLLLPAVQAARESMRRAACADKIRQIALGMHGHHDAQRRLPLGQIPPMLYWQKLDGSFQSAHPGTGNVKMDRRSWMHMICPYLEMTDVYDEIVTALTLNTQWPYTLACASKKPPLFMCPSDSNAGKISKWVPNGTSRGFCGNYLAAASSGSFGATGGGTALDGLFFASSKVAFAEISDGLSKTVMLGETVVAPDPSTGVDLRGGYFNASAGESFFSTQYQPNTSVGDGLEYANNWRPQAPTGSTKHVQYTRSWHSGGVNVAMADGSTRFVLNTVDLTVWTASGSRNGSEPTGALD